MTRGTSEGNFEVLGVNDAEWINDKKIIFHSYERIIQVDLKR